MIRRAGRGEEPKGEPPEVPRNPGSKKKKAFGTYTISFKGCKDVAESIFGTKPIGPSVMTKKIWAYVKRKRLAKR